MIRQFRKKPVVIEAMEFTGTNAPACAEFISQGRKVIGTYEPETTHFWIETLEGTMLARPGDWIIKGVNGEFCPCKPDIFTKTYEPA